MDHTCFAFFGEAYVCSFHVSAIRNFDNIDNSVWQYQCNFRGRGELMPLVPFLPFSLFEVACRTSKMNNDKNMKKKEEKQSYRSNLAAELEKIVMDVGKPICGDNPETPDAWEVDLTSISEQYRTVAIEYLGSEYKSFELNGHKHNIFAFEPVKAVVNKFAFGYGVSLFNDSYYFGCLAWRLTWKTPGGDSSTEKVDSVGESVRFVDEDYMARRIIDMIRYKLYLESSESVESDRKELENEGDLPF